MAGGLSGMAYGKSSGGDKKSSSLEDEHFTDAFDAAAKGDRRAFIASMKAAVEACIQSYGGDAESKSEDASEPGEE